VPLSSEIAADRSGWPAAETMIHWLALMVSVALVVWIRLIPLSLPSLDIEARARVLNEQARQIEIPSTIPASERDAERRRRLIQWRTKHRAEFESACKLLTAQMRSQLTYAGEDGGRHVFLGDADSYHWLRMARNYLRTGTTCDAIVNGQCLDTYTNAPVGRRNVYSRSVHIAAILVVHRLANFFKPGYPLAASSFLVPVIVGVLGVFPAYALGRRFGGELSGLCAALMSGLNPLFLQRSIGSDDDVWNVVLPLFMVWAVVEALYSARTRMRASYSLLAAGFAGLHAAVWGGWVFTYEVVLVGLLADLTLEGARYVIGKFADRDTALAALRGVMTVTAIFYVGTGAFTNAGNFESYLRLPLDLVRPLFAGTVSHPPAVSADWVTWPDVFATVAELAALNLSAIADLMGARVLLFVSWLGLLVVLLPKSSWKAQHFMLLIGGNYLYWYLLTAPPLGRSTLLMLIAAPVAGVILADLFSETSDNVGGGLILIMWFFSALFLSYQAIRLAMLLVPPFAIGFGAAVGRLQGWLDRQVTILQPGIQWLSRPVIFVLLASVLTIPVWQGYTTASRYMPMVDDAWYSALADVREKSPSESIVNTWWDYGYWTKYLAYRRVNADGGSLLTHIPYWTARALAAPTERESAGLLRMIDCGSDATPQPEGREGAYGKLLSYQVDGLRAVAIVSNLSRMGRAEARAYLANEKLDYAAQDDILRSTHCDPPPSYLLLSSQMSPPGGWWYLANWDFGRGYMLERAQMLPEASAIAQLTTHFGYSAQAADVLYSEALALKSKTQEMSFGAPSSVSVAPRWITCRSETSALVCDTNLTIGPKTVVEKVTYESGDPAGSRLLLAHSDGAPSEEVSPSAVIIAQAGGAKDFTISSAPYPALGLLVDTAHAQVIVDSPAFLRSTYSRLVYLDGDSGQFFTKVYEKTGFWNEQVTLWKIDWQRLLTDDQRHR
jgi:hypothetical protein